MSLNRKRKIKFKNNSEYLLPKVVQDNSVLNFNVDFVDIEIFGNIGYLNIYYNISSIKYIKYLNTMIKKENNLFSCDYCMNDNILYYCCKYSIPKCNVFFANMCLHNTCVYQKSDIDEMINFCGCLI